MDSVKMCAAKNFGNMAVKGRRGLGSLVFYKWGLHFSLIHFKVKNSLLNSV